MQLLHAGQWHNPHNTILNGCPSDVFNKQLTTHGLWPTRFPDLNPCDYSFLGDTKDKSLSKKSAFCAKNKDSIQREIINILDKSSITCH
jgi:hypothetical protein